MKPPTAQTVMADPLYRRLKEYLISSTGMAYYADKDIDLAGRIAQRLEKLAISDCDSYLNLLKDGAAGEAELDCLIEELTIGETFFFRHREMFDALRDTVLPERIASNQQSRQLRIWSAGCSTGAEAYTLSIVLRRDLGVQIAGWDVTIVGTDINREFLSRAREGRFEEWAFRTTTEELKRTCFLPDGKAWRIKPEYQQGVSFQYHNMVTHPYPSLLNNLFAFDLILCRNVTIYFTLDIVQRIVGHFHQCLVEGGWLGVGHSEPNMEIFRAYRTVNAPGVILYQKKQPGTITSTWVPPLQPHQDPQPMTAPLALQPWAPPVLPWLVTHAPEITRDLSALTPLPTAAPAPAARPISAVAPMNTTAVVAGNLEAIRSLADRGEWSRAAECCAQALSNDKLNPIIYFYQALVQEQLGRHVDAENSLRRCIYLDRNYVLAHYYLGLLQQKKGLLQPAARSFKNVQKLLEPLPPEQVFMDGDGITVAELYKLTHMHLSVLEGT